MSVKTRQDKTASLAERGDLSDLFATALTHIRGNKRGELQRTNLRRALQLFNENRLGAVVPGMTESLPANLLELLSMPPKKILPESISRYVEVRYFGELFLPASHWSSGKTAQALQDFVANLGIPYDLDLDAVGWVPPYALDAEVLSIWNTPMHEIRRGHDCYMARHRDAIEEPRACESVGEYLRMFANRTRFVRYHRDPAVGEYLKSLGMYLPMFIPKSWTPPASDLEMCKRYGYEDWDGIEVLSWKKEEIQKRGFPTIESLSEQTQTHLTHQLEHLTPYALELMEKKGLTSKSDENPVLDADVNSLMFSFRTSSCLKNANIRRVGQLVEMTEGDFLRLPNSGRKSLNEIKAALAEHNLSMKR